MSEALVDYLAELGQAQNSAIADYEFRKEFECHFSNINRPLQIYLAENLSKDAGGAKYLVKTREDLYVS